MATIGLIGLGVMGQNLALNIAERGHRILVFNRSAGRTETFLAGEDAGRFGVAAAGTLEEFVAGLERPRSIILMVSAGAGTDAQIEALLPLLEPGDLIIDGGNAHYPDTIRRERALAERGLLVLGAGISGGEVGARRGPSIMAGGAP
ncbi:MAG: NAD(P)-binding domain-containing protein, partial [Geminicoccaceae bacterium]|nr:NAD(P)-binding domain-containing protein [Geminicoccaceae bacterium]